MWARHSEITKLNHSVGRKKQLLEIKLSRLPLGRQRKTKCERASGSDVTVSKVGSLRWSRLFRLTIGVPGRQKPRDYWGVPNLDFCSLSLGLPYGGPLNTQGKLPKRNSFKKSPKLTGFTLTLPPQEYVKTVHSHTSRDQPIKPTRNKDQQRFLEETCTNWGSWKEHAILVGLPAGCAVCSWFKLTRAVIQGWTLVMHLSLIHVCSYKQLLTYISVNNPNKAH